MQKKELESLYPLFDEKIAELGYILLDVEFVKEHGERILRFFIDSDQGIHVDDCESVSQMLSPLLDTVDPIDEAYLLEVCSPDLSRPLRTARDFERTLHTSIEVYFYQKRENQKYWEGMLEGWDEEAIYLQRPSKEETDRIDRTAISKILRAVKF